MVQKKTDNLEKALAKKANDSQLQISKEEEIGFHKGALNTLVKEREGLIQLIAVVESTMQAHLKRLEQLGINIPKK